MELLSREVVQLQVDVVLIGTDTSTLHDLDGHRARHHIARGQVLRNRGVSLHKSLALRIHQETSFS